MIEVVNDIPKRIKTSPFDAKIESIVSLALRNATKIVRVTTEPRGLVARFRLLKKAGKFEDISVKVHGETFYFSAREI